MAKKISIPGIRSVVNKGAVKESAPVASKIEPQANNIKSAPATIKKSQLVNSGVPERFWRALWGEVPDGDYKNILLNYVVNMDLMLSEGRGLLLWGPNRFGKTSCAVLLLKEVLAHKVDTFFVRVADFVDDKLRMKTFDELDDSTLEDMVVDASFLVFDDLGKEIVSGNAKAIRIIDNLLRRREASKRATIVTTNIPVSEIEKVTSQSTMRILMDVGYPVHINQRDYSVELQKWYSAFLNNKH